MAKYNCYSLGTNQASGDLGSALTWKLLILLHLDC